MQPRLQAAPGTLRALASWTEGNVMTVHLCDLLPMSRFVLSNAQCSSVQALLHRSPAVTGKPHHTI